MTKNILVLAITMMISPLASAQEFGALLGVHQTTADSDMNGVSIDGKFNFKMGVLAAFELTDGAKFRSGLLYNQRRFESKSGGLSTDVNFDYFDVPALIQYNPNDMFGFFGGLVVAVNVNDDVETPAGVAVTDSDADTLIPLLSVGVNFTFDDMIGFDVYYERGLGGFAESLENYSTYGANFLYWF